MRIVAHDLSQSGPQRVGADVTGDLSYVFLPAQSMVVVSLLPKRTAPVQLLVDPVGGTRLDILDHLSKRCRLAHLKEPMQVIWHHHPSQGVHDAGIVEPAHLGNHHARQP